MILSQYFILDYLPMRNLNFCCSRGSAEYAHAWLSSNEEFEWIGLVNPSPDTDFLDYLPMRNLNLSFWRTFHSPFIALIIFQWGIWIFPYKKRLGSLSPLIIFQWGIWIKSLKRLFKYPVSPWLSSNEEFECYFLLRLRNMSLLLIIFQWGIWMACWPIGFISFISTWLSSNEEFESKKRQSKDRDKATWLSSNEEFEYLVTLFSGVVVTSLIIFQWGIWIFITPF